jgi:Kef-type K+ transport system membrane component KefB/nucleotide-binding universal stress UspA family protein
MILLALLGGRDWDIDARAPPCAAATLSSGRQMNPRLPTRRLVCLWTAALLAAGVTGALAQDGAKAPSEVVFLAELIVLMLVGRLLGEAMQRIGQPTVMGQLLSGILLGPSVLGWLWPDLQHWIFPAAREQKAMIDAISQFGILLLLLLTGMETDLKLVRKFGHIAISISLAGVAVPFACGVTLGALLPASLLPNPDKRVLTSLFLGTALSISSIKIVAAVVREMNFTRRNLGQVIVASAVLDDTIGWVIIAITFSLAEAAEIDVAGVGRALIGTTIFLIGSFTVGRRIVFYLIRWANDNFSSDFPVITTILVIMGGMALITHFIGVHTVLGAFIAGMLIGQSPILTKHIDEQLRGLIVAFFMPVFFGLAGLGTDLTILRDPQLLLMALGLIAVASIGKFAGALAGGKLGGLTRREALALAFAMNARGSTEVIVATIGLSMGALTHDLFTMIVAMAMATTLAMPPMLRWGLARVPMSTSEKERLEREEIDAKGFVPNLERLLLAVDGSPNGRFASRLAGLIAGPRGLPTTVLPLMANEGTKPCAAVQDDIPADVTERATEETTADTLEAAAEDARKTQRKEDKAASTDITVRQIDAPPPEAVAREAKKGYDLLFVGFENTRTKSGGFHQDVTRIASGFEGPLAIVAANGVHRAQPEQRMVRILVPVNGTDVSRRAAEAAIAIARVQESPVTVLYVSRQKPSDRRKPVRRSRGRAHEQAILKDIVAIADQYELQIKTVRRADIAPDEAILLEAERTGCDLIVMGVTRRSGEPLFFGETAAAVFEKAPTSVVLLAT